MVDIEDAAWPDQCISGKKERLPLISYRCQWRAHICDLKVRICELGQLLKPRLQIKYIFQGHTVNTRTLVQTLLADLGSCLPPK